MTISDNYEVTPQVGNGSTVDFSEDWSLLSSDFLVVELEVIATGVRTLQVLNTDFTLVFDDGGLIVTFITAPPATDNVIISRNVAASQIVPYTTSTGFNGKVTEGSFDKVTAQNQDQQDAIDRSLRAEVGADPTVDYTVPTPEAGKTFKWNVTADALENTTFDPDEAQTDSAANVVLTNADVVLTNADVVLTGLDVISTNADVVLTNADVVLTGLDVVSTNADVVLTNADVVSTNADVVLAANSAEAIGFKWEYDSTTAMADPTSTKMRLNNATPASVTAIAVADNSADTGNPDVSVFVLSWDDSTNTANRGYLTVREIANPEKFATYKITGSSTDNVGWTQLAVTYLTGSGTFTNTNDLMLTFSQSGDAGSVTVDDSLFRIQDNADATKEIAFEANGITTGTTRTITMPDADIDLGNLGGGKVLQVVNAKITSGLTDITTTSYVDIANETITITPLSITSTMYIEVNNATHFQAGSAGATGEIMRIIEGASNALTYDTTGQAAINEYASRTLLAQYVNTTLAAKTFKVQAKRSFGSIVCRHSHDTVNNIANIRVWEVEA
ncbi:hypothetical protein KAR91_03180 [Candidatus Pacearchaeota archaeon]|nr:hypothetical protein [Candidatus Pacearchaeota archaeon]